MPSAGRKREPDRARQRLGWRGLLKVRVRLMADQEGRCFYCLRTIYINWMQAPDLEACRKRLATVDHIEPLSKGGTWKRHNLCAACSECNSRKGVLSEEEFHAIIMDELSRPEVESEERYA